MALLVFKSAVSSCVLPTKRIAAPQCPLNPLWPLALSLFSHLKSLQIKLFYNHNWCQFIIRTQHSRQYSILQSTCHSWRQKTASQSFSETCIHWIIIQLCPQLQTLRCKSKSSFDLRPTCMAVLACIVLSDSFTRAYSLHQTLVFSGELHELKQMSLIGDFRIKVVRL